MPSDAYKYFRIEAKELLESLTQGILELERGNFSRDLAGRLLRYAHTLKGAARIVNEIKISEMSHRIEDILSSYRAEESPAISAQHMSDLLKLTDEIARALPSPGHLDTAEKSEKPHVGTASPPEEGFETVRIEIDEMDAFLHQVARTAVYETGLKQEIEGFDDVLQKAGDLAELSEVSAGSSRRFAGARELYVELRRLRERLAAANEKAEVEILRLQDRARELRLLPASSIFASLDRAARDAARSLDRKIDFCASGGENRLDAHVLRPLRDALLHIVRNAVAHGIEPEAQRIAAGKPPAGRVQVTVERRSNRISFTCEDDGGGIDVEQVRRMAVERELISPDQATNLQPQEAIQLLLQGGVTTARTLTEISGRGVGLDVVRATLTRLKGEVSVQSEPRKGTVVNLSVPISLEALNVIEVEAGGAVVSVPFDSVLRGLRAGSDQVVRSEKGDAILFDQRMVPFAPLVSFLRPGLQTMAQPPSWSVLIIRVNASLAAIGVDRFLRRTNVMVRPLPKLAGPVELIGGASLDSEGQPRLLIDPVALVRMVGSGVRPVLSTPKKKTPVLVIDDSLTTRMLEQSILETAGYEVDLSWSAEEALKKIQHKKYALFVVDVEMPGMNGFEFIEHVRSNADTRGIPSILVTSRDSIEDRRRGEQAGALGYIVKSEFNEGQLLSTIRRLIQ